MCGMQDSPAGRQSCPKFLQMRRTCMLMVQYHSYNAAVRYMQMLKV